MYRSNSILALIPARGGSKGLPGKNLMTLAEKPLIAWTIEQAKGSSYIDRLLVSSDDGAILRTAKHYGAEAPFVRPQELARDDSKSIDVVFHAIDWCLLSRIPMDVLMLLQVTSPLRTTDDIDRAVELFFDREAGAVVSVCETTHHPYWTNTLGDDLSMKSFLKPSAVTNRQELPRFYRINGALYIGSVDYIREIGGFFGPKTFAYIMPRERSVDIDTKMDLDFAEFLMKQGHQRTEAR
jgi:N-acylneuraminate cytidylyltransferase/CMP-N,N'-diacetyllegionaminic acid synthase